MWFKNARFFWVDGLTLGQDLANHDGWDKLAFRSVGKLSASARGWAPVYGTSDGEPSYVLSPSSVLHLMCFQVEEKILPAASINALTAERVAAFERAEGRRVNKRERAQFRDDVLAGVLPTALTRIKRTWAYFDLSVGVLVVDAVSQKICDEVIDFLRRVLGDFGCAPVLVKDRPEAVLTHWLSSIAHVPPDVVLGLAADLDFDGSSIRFRRHPLVGAEISEALAAGAEVVKLALRWEDRLAFSLDAELSLRGIRFLDLVVQERSGVESDSVVDALSADFVIQAGEFRRLLAALVVWFGGILKREG